MTRCGCCGPTRVGRSIVDSCSTGCPWSGSQRSGSSSSRRLCGQPSASLRSTSVRYGKGRHAVLGSRAQQAIEHHGAARSLVRVQGSTVYRTDLQGTILVEVADSGRYTVHVERGEGSRPPPPRRPPPSPAAERPRPPASTSILPASQTFRRSSISDLSGRGGSCNCGRSAPLAGIQLKRLSRRVTIAVILSSTDDDDVG